MSLHVHIILFSFLIIAMFAMAVWFTRKIMEIIKSDARLYNKLNHIVSFSLSSGSFTHSGLPAWICLLTFFFECVLYNIYEWAVSFI